jgi:hypothetical protein
VIRQTGDHARCDKAEDSWRDVENDAFFEFGQPQGKKGKKEMQDWIEGFLWAPNSQALAVVRQNCVHQIVKDQTSNNPNAWRVGKGFNFERSNCYIHLRYAPDSQHLAFGGGANCYIVDTRRRCEPANWRHHTLPINSNITGISWAEDICGLEVWTGGYSYYNVNMRKCLQPLTGEKLLRTVADWIEEHDHQKQKEMHENC